MAGNSDGENIDILLYLLLTSKHDLTKPTIIVNL